MQQAYRVFLLWQELRDGRKQLRRFSPDRPGKFLGYEKQTAQANDWLNMHDHPKWPDDAFRIKPDSVPFCVVQE